MPRHTPDYDLNQTLYTIDLFVFCSTYNCICICVPILLCHIIHCSNFIGFISLVFVSVFALVFVLYCPVSRHTPDDDFWDFKSFVFSNVLHHFNSGRGGKGGKNALIIDCSGERGERENNQLFKLDLR